MSLEVTSTMILLFLVFVFSFLTIADLSSFSYYDTVETEALFGEAICSSYYSNSSDLVYYLNQNLYSYNRFTKNFNFILFINKSRNPYSSVLIGNVIHIISKNYTNHLVKYDIETSQFDTLYLNFALTSNIGLTGD